MDTTALIHDLISDFQARKWDSKPMEKVLRLANATPQAIATFARAVMDELPEGGMFLHAALAYLPEQDWPELVRSAVEHLRSGPKNEAAESILNYASLQCLPAVHPFLSELFLLSERWELYDIVYAWRESGTAQLDFLTRQLNAEADPASGQPNAVGPKGDTQQDRALSSLLETRDMEALRVVCAYIFALGDASEYLIRTLARVDIEQEGDGFRRLAPASVYHLHFPAGYVEDPLYLNGADFSKWEPLAPETYSYRFGGTLETICSRCGSPLCHRTMPFLMQLDSNLKTADGYYMHWGDGGIAFLFWCDACRLSAITWQCP